MGLTNRRQIAIAIEGTPGTAETITAADNIPNISNISMTFNPLVVERNIIRESLTDLPVLVPGQNLVDVSFDVEVGGHPNNPQTQFEPAEWDRCLRLCGFEQVTDVRQFTIGAVTSGPFRHGETITQTGSGATAVVVSDVFNGTTTLFAELASGTPNGTGVLTGGTSGATATPSAVSTNEYLAWRLISSRSDMESGTVQIHMDDKILKLAGVRGSVDFNFTHANPVRLSVTLTGKFVSYIDGALLTGGTLAEDQNVPPTFFNATLELTDSSGNEWDASTFAVMNQAAFAMNNQVVGRENSLSPEGVAFTEITDRAPSGSFNPDELLNSEFDFVNNMLSSDSMVMRILWGSSTGNMFTIQAPGVVFNQLAPQDRDGLHVWDAGFRVTGGDYGGGTPGSDNEFALIYH